MKSVLIAARNADACRVLSGYIDDAAYEVSTATDGMTIRGIDVARFSFIFISVPLENETGLDLFAELRKRTPAHLFAIVREEAAAGAAKRLSPFGAYIITKPVYKGSLMQAIRFCETHAANEEECRRRIAELERKAETDRLVFRAQLIIIAKEQLDEDGAYRRLQKLAMDTRQSLTDTARDIIDGLLI